MASLRIEESPQNRRERFLVTPGGKRLRLVNLPRREALSCTPDELVETTWESREETREERRRRIFAEAEEFRKNHSGRPMEELMEEARQLRGSLPKGLKVTDSVELFREDRER